MSRITTVFDARREKYLAEASRKGRTRRAGFQVLDSQGLPVSGICQTRDSACRFMRDSLNTSGWEVVEVRSPL